MGHVEYLGGGEGTGILIILSIPQALPSIPVYTFLGKDLNFCLLAVMNFYESRTPAWLWGGGDDWQSSLFDYRVLKISGQE